eukprot:s42_g30.t4
MTPRAELVVKLTSWPFACFAKPSALVSKTCQSFIGYFGFNKQNANTRQHCNPHVTCIAHIFNLASAMRRLPWLLAVFAGLAGRTWLAPIHEAEHPVRLGRRGLLLATAAGLPSSAAARDLSIEEPLIYCGGGFCATFRLVGVLPLSFVAPRIPRCEEEVSASSPRLCGSVPSAPSSRVVVSAHSVTVAGRLLTELSARPVLSATSAGVCAAVVMAFLGAIIDPIKDRILGRRLYYGPGQSWRCRFEIGFVVQIIKTCGLYTRAALAGLLFAVLTLPFTNFRLGVSNQTMASSPFKAILPTIARDIAYSLGRAALPAMIIAHYSSRAHRLTSSSPEVLFGAVAGACLLAAPFNELRDRQLSKSHAAHFMPFRSTLFAVIRSLLQAESLVLGYRYAPDAVRAVVDGACHWKFSKGVMASWKVAPDVEFWALAGAGSVVVGDSSVVLWIQEVPFS